MKTIGKISQVIKMNSTRDHFNMNTVIQALFKFMSSVKTGSKFSKTLLILTQNSFKKYFEKTVLFYFRFLLNVTLSKYIRNLCIFTISRNCFLWIKLLLYFEVQGDLKNQTRQIDTNF